MSYRLMSRFHILSVLPVLLLLVGCFETLEKEKKDSSGQSSQRATVLEDRFESEITALQSLSLNGTTLEGMWVVFYSENVAESDGELVGIDSWSILEISHEAESTSLQVLNHANCQASSPETYRYTIETSTISASSFRITNTNSFLFPAANSEVRVEIDESGRVLEFSDYVKATDDANSISMKAYKARDVIADSIGSFTLGGNDYSVSCLSYSDSWVLTEVIGDDLRYSEQMLKGSGSASLIFSITEAREELEQTSQTLDSDRNDYILATIEAVDVSEQFRTESVGGVTSAITLNINSNLSIGANFSRSDGLEAVLDVDLVNVKQ